MKDALALALVHFIWQGAVLAVVGWSLMRLARVPSVRYAIGVATMMAMLAAPALTFLALANADGVVVPAAPAPGGAARPGEPASMPRQVQSPSSARGLVATPEIPSPTVIVPTSWILTVWSLGVMVLSLRFIGGWAVAHRLATRALAPVNGDLQLLAARLAARLNVRGAVRVCESASVAVPIMVGWLRPVIVLPAAALAALPLAQVEALLAHEFAHIRRHDYLVNLLQAGVETLCFYHPAVWWISREVRRHREHCCDDVAVGVCDRLTYVTALSSLASMSTPQFALSATGGSLRDRVRRLIEPTVHSASPKGAWIAMLPILVVVSLVAPYAWGAQSPTPASAMPAARPAVEAAAVPVAQAVPATGQAKPVPAPISAAPVGVARPSAVRVTSRQERPVEVAQAIEARKAAQEAEEVLARRRLELEHQFQATRSQYELATLEARLRNEEAAFARSRQLFERGLATTDAVAEAKSRIEATRQKLEFAQRNRALTEQEFDLRRAEVALQHAATTHRGVPQAEIVGRLDPAATLQPQDQLTITIANEPDLPTTFTVRPDGSIRFPLLGTIPVEHSTARQVQAIIQKLLAEKGLGQGNLVVTVSAGRVR